MMALIIMFRLEMEKGMNIEHIGRATLHSKQSNSFFTLDNLMHVPFITKNLVSVSKFAKDKNVLFEFHHNLCYVKS